MGNILLEGGAAPSNASDVSSAPASFSDLPESRVLTLLEDCTENNPKMSLGREDDTVPTSLGDISSRKSLKTVIEKSSRCHDNGSPQRQPSISFNGLISLKLVSLPSPYGALCHWFASKCHLELAIGPSILGYFEGDFIDSLLIVRIF